MLIEISVKKLEFAANVPQIAGIEDKSIRTLTTIDAMNVAGAESRPESEYFLSTG
jgi:hypothetical protein